MAVPAPFASKTRDPLRKGYALQGDRKIHRVLCISDRVERMLYGPNLTSAPGASRR